MNKFLCSVLFFTAALPCFAQDEGTTTAPAPKAYIVIVDGNMLKCMDAQGSVLGSLSNVGNVVQAPQVNGDQCSVIVESEQFGKALYVYRLPSFSQISFQQIP